MHATIDETRYPNPADRNEPGSNPDTPARSRKAVWTGRILTGLAVSFLVLDAGVKLLALPAAVEATTRLGYPVSTLVPIGIIELACLVIYLIPRTALIGAILWTGYLGGAIASQYRAGNPLFSNTLFPTYIAALIWAGLWLRDRRVNALFAR